jgi:flagellar biosynthesis protein
MIDSNSEIAVALRYEGNNAPHISAKGYGEIASEIIEIAKKHNIPLYENSDLAQLLSLLELGEEIPEILYVAIAEVLSFAYWLTGKVPEGYSEME